MKIKKNHSYFPTNLTIKKWDPDYRPGEKLKE